MLDAHGRLSLRGRGRDEINKGGMKIYPADIDAMVERFAQASDVCSFALDDEIPRTSRGKINRDAVTAACVGQPARALVRLLAQGVP